MSAFSDFAALRSRLASAPGPHVDARAGAEARNAQLTKPPASFSSLSGTIGSNQVLKLTEGTLSLITFKQLFQTRWCMQNSI